MVEEKSTTTTTTAAAKQTVIHVTALDGIVTMNSLFTAAMFIGLSMTAPENATTVLVAACTAKPETVRQLIVYEVLSFSCFLFSSLLAQSLKLQINLRNSMKDPSQARMNVRHLKYCLTAAAAGSVVGCVFLMLSIVDFIRVKLGSLSCGGKPVTAVVVLVVLVGCGLLVYAVTAVLALVTVDEEEEEVLPEA
ncbi:uncharacterized protein LOC125221483 [Salvia hispanica]|uniref:uncharacterized protein LOC125221483 n=1 Tax=Salvia hispanica TaxID=49212 RepID=UPI0020095948|nr:uncharacterized protein LOC125221483 [Salvia hispanica]